MTFKLTGFVPVGYLKTIMHAASVDNDSSHCGCLSDYPQLPGHLWVDAAVHVLKRALNLMENILSTYYKCPLSAVTRKWNVLRHVDTANFCSGTWNTCPKFVRTFVIPYIHITSQSRALLEKLSLGLLLKNFPAFYGAQRFTAMFTRALHWSLSQARSIHSIPPHPIQDQF
jgi:hypothetical protein